jgi:hypothetical protein
MQHSTCVQGNGSSNCGLSEGFLVHSVKKGKRRGQEKGRHCASGAKVDLRFEILIKPSRRPMWPHVVRAAGPDGRMCSQIAHCTTLDFD